MLPPSSFAREFRAHVVPKLSALCEVQAALVALGMATIREAHAEVMLEAWRHDVAALPEEHFEQLESWIMDTLCARACVARDRQEARSASMAHVAADIERWNASVWEAFTVQ